MDITKGYKAFDKGMVCRGKKYAENETFEEEGGEICSKGMMHYCVNPLDCLHYYPLIDKNGCITEFAEVQALEEPVTDDEIKYATKKLHIGKKLTFNEFVDVSVKALNENFDGVYANYENITSQGNEAQIVSQGNYVKIASQGNYVKIASQGNYVKIASQGDKAQIVSQGNRAQIASQGWYAQIASQGNEAQIISNGSNSIIICSGINSMVKAKKGSWITLTQWKLNALVCVKTEQVDGKRIKEDTFYQLVDGNFVEVKKNGAE